MNKPFLAPALAVLLLPVAPGAPGLGDAALAGDDPPAVEHQPAPCTVPGKAISLCAAISDDVAVATARLYFRRAGEDYYSFVAMAFTGVEYCGTIPAPREGKIQAIEYYIHAVDNAYQPTRTSTYRLAVQPEGVCEFPPIEKDAARAAAIKVVATNRKQGKKLDDGFVATGVTFVPVAQ
jgi:hypothetical protein